MLPPIPNCSKFIDKFPEEGCSEDNEKDKRKQEAYAAEVKVYRALESLQEDIVVLHSLHYTNRQLRLYKKDHQFDEDKPNKEAGECDFVVIGEHFVIVIEVSDVRIDDGITSNKRVKTAFNRKKKQAARTKELVDLIMNPSESGATSNVRWFCAFHSISSEIGAKLFQPEQTRNIIFSDFLDTSMGSEEYQNNFQLWWIKNGLSTSKNECYPIALRGKIRLETIKARHNILIGLWNIDSQNNINPEEGCSLGSNIMKVDAQLRNADITYGFRNPERPGFNNPNFVKADDVFAGMGISYLTKEQDEIFKSREKFRWVNGPAGSGKTLLLLGKAITAAKSGDIAVIFTNCDEDRDMEIYHKTLIETGIPFDLVKFRETDIEGLWKLPSTKALEIIVAEKVRLLLSSSFRAIIFSCVNKSLYEIKRCFGIDGLTVIEKVILRTIQTWSDRRREAVLHFFVDDEQCLLDYESYDRYAKVKELEDMTVANDHCFIWVFSDITQTSNHVSEQHFKDMINYWDSINQTYSPQTLSLNLRNTCDIAKILSVLRRKTVFPGKLLKSHYIHGPLPVVHLFGNDTRYKLYKGGDTELEMVIKKELDRILDSKNIQASNIGLVCNDNSTQKVLQNIVENTILRTNCVNKLLYTCSAEWPAVILLLDMNRTRDFAYEMLHTLYFGLSRARVYFVAVLILPEIFTSGGYRDSKPMPWNAMRILKDLERLAAVKNHLETSTSFEPEMQDLTLNPLHYAMNLRHNMNLDIVRSIIESGVYVDSRLAFMSTPLHLAAKVGKLCVVQYLLEHGADVKSRTSDESTPIHYAAKVENLDVVQILIKYGSDVNSINSDMFTPLHFAAERGTLDIVECLVESGAMINCPNKDMITPLHLAAEHQNFHVVRFLIESGADVNCKTSKMLTPLHFAARDSNFSLVQFLVDSGADVNCETSDKFTPLHFAASAIDEWTDYIVYDIVRFLVDSGADVNCETSDKFTPLHFAASAVDEWGDYYVYNIVRVLVESGANVNCETSDKLTPLDFATKTGDLDVMLYLVDSELDELYYHACKKRGIRSCAILGSTRSSLDQMFTVIAQLKRVHSTE